MEIAHVLFMDLVGHSRLPMHEQTRLVEQLQVLVRGTPEFRRADQNHEMLCLPRGDGAALVFFRDPLAPVRCALEIAHALRETPTVRLRMGIHSGPVQRVEDINANLDVSGGGINMARRVVDCGDTGHILISNTVAEFLEQIGTWSHALQDLGTCEVKHGVRLHLFNLCLDGLGNPNVPESLGGHPPVEPPPAALAVPTVAPPSAPSTRNDAPPVSTSALAETPPSVGPAAKTGLRVALLYKRDEEPDGYLLALLEKALGDHGHHVFIDRHVAIGMKWAEEIERQIRTSDAVIPLLSAVSVRSEMLEYEVQIAHEAAQVQRGKPRLLPVRVAYTDRLPTTLHNLLQPLNYTLWNGPEDDQRLVSELLAALREPESKATTVVTEMLETPGGAVPLASAFYVVRPTDQDFRYAIARRDSIVLVKGARQVGKTSLLARGLQQAREAGARVVLTDFQKLNAAHLESADTLFLTLAEWMADQLDLDVQPEEMWNSRRGANMNFERYLRKEVLGKLDAHMVWGMDEVDRLFTCEFASEVFGLFRSWHNERSLDHSAPWSRLTLAIAFATEAHLFITDVNQSPFNVGTRLALDDFSFEQVEDLNQRYGCPLPKPADVATFYRLLKGHPGLSHRGLHEMATQNMTLSAFESQAGRDEGIFGDHLRRILVALAKNPDLTDIVRGILRGRPCPNEESFYRLRSGGLMAGDSRQDVRPRCQLYATYLEHHLL